MFNCDHTFYNYLYKNTMFRCPVSLSLLSTRMCISLLLVLFLPISVYANDLDEITIGYFQEWPTPFMTARGDQKFEQEMGVKIAWQAFETGEDMSRALEAKEIQIAYAQELIPFLAGASQGLDIIMTGIAVSYSEYELCVTRKDFKINKHNAKDLEGKKIALVKGSSPHFKLLKILEHLGVDKDKVELVFVRHGRAASRMLYYSKVTVACAFGASVVSMKQKGEYLLTAEEQEAIGLKMFDLIAMAGWFLRENRNFAQKFMDFVAKANARYSADPNSMLIKIAKGAGIKFRSTQSLLEIFDFPTPTEQISSHWLGGGGLVTTYSKELAEFLVSHGKLENALDDYNPYIDIDLLR